MLPKFIGPFRVTHRVGNAYTLELPPRMRTPPTFYVGRLRPYHQFEASSDEKEAPFAQESQGDFCDPESELQSDSAPMQAHYGCEQAHHECKQLIKNLTVHPLHVEFHLDKLLLILQLSLLNLMQNRSIAR